MSVLIAGLLLFFIPHSLSIVNEDLRDRCEARLGELGWKGLYSVVSLAGMVLIVMGYGEARLTAELLYSPPPALRHVAMLLLALAFPLIVATYFPGRIKAMVKHPMLLGTALWGLAHLALNGSVADVLLFGSFALWALLDLWSMRSREQRAIVTVPVFAWNDIVAIVVGLGVYGVFVVKAHVWLTGVALVS